MKRKYLSGAYLVAASALMPQAVFAHGGVDGGSIIVTVLHSLAHLAGNLSAPGLIAIGLGIVAIACIKVREKNS
jgi:hypothetical protein